MENELIINYDEKNDSIAGVLKNESGYLANYGICDSIFLGFNNFHLPMSIHVSNASKVFGVPKQLLINSEIEFQIDCDEMLLFLSVFMDGLLIFSTHCNNRFGVSNASFFINSNF